MALSGGHGFDLMYVNLKSHVFLPSRRYATLYLHILYILKDNIRIWLVLLIDPSHLYWCGYKRVVEQLLIASSSKKNPLKKVKCHAVTIWNCPLLSPPNEFEQGTMKRAPYVCVSVRPSVRVSVCASVCDQNLQFATALSFMSQFWFCLLYMIALHGSFETSTQNFSRDLWPWPLTYIVHFATKCYSFAISNPISIPFALCDGTRWGLQNFYTEFWPLTSLTFDLDFLTFFWVSV